MSPGMGVVLQVWDVAEDIATRSAVLDAGGHRSDIRCVSVSPDDSLLLSASGAGAKVHHKPTPCTSTLCNNRRNRLNFASE